MKKIKLLTALALASAAFAVSAQNIATVNGKPIPKSLQDEWVAQLVANGGKDTPEARRQITENLVANALVEQEAAKRKISDDPKVKFALDYAKFRILQEALLRDEMAKHPVSEKEIKARYEEEKAALGNKEYEVSHILVKDQKTAENIEKKLAAGGNFAALAKEFSVDTGAKENGGDLGWNRPAVFVKPFADAVKNMKKGEISKAPVKTEFGWHIIKVNDVKEVPFPTYDSVKDQIREGLELKKQQNFLNELMRPIRSNTANNPFGTQQKGAVAKVCRKQTFNSSFCI